MRLVSYGHFGSECAGFLDGDKVFDLEQAMKVTGAEKPVSDIRLFLEQPDWRSTLDRAYAARSNLLPVAPSRIGAPVPIPRTLIIAGANTKSHIAEAGAVLGETVGPCEPMLLAKATSSICGPADDIIYPPETRKLDYEVELAVVMGCKARRIAEKDVKDYVADSQYRTSYRRATFNSQNTRTTRSSAPTILARASIRFAHWDQRWSQSMNSAGASRSE
jgi:2,4-didehydro-3-deoxy-L-rhamnonate hydrolase